MALNKGIWDPKLRGTNIKGTNLKSVILYSYYTTITGWGLLLRDSAHNYLDGQHIIQILQESMNRQNISLLVLSWAGLPEAKMWL